MTMTEESRHQLLVRSGGAAERLLGTGRAGRGFGLACMGEVGRDLASSLYRKAAGTGQLIEGWNLTVKEHAATQYVRSFAGFAGQSLSVGGTSVGTGYPSGGATVCGRPYGLDGRQVKIDPDGDIAQIEPSIDPS